VIPLFILMGNFATQGGISRALFELAAAVMGRLQGRPGDGGGAGLRRLWRHLRVLGGHGRHHHQVALPEMRRHGYSGRLSTGTLAAGGTLGILIPPSVPLVIYAILAEQNIAKLFAAAMVPGLIAMLGYMIAIAIYVRVVPGQAPEHDEAPAPHAARAVGHAADRADLPGRLRRHLRRQVHAHRRRGGRGGGHLRGGAGQARDHLGEVGKHCFYATAEASAMIFLIFLGADLMNAALALTQVPAQLAGWSRAGACRRWDGGGGHPALLRGAGRGDGRAEHDAADHPHLLPDGHGLDFGMPKESVAIWFGIMVLMTVGFGLLAPPVGLNVYVVNGMARDVPIAESYRGVMPFLISDTVRTLLLLLFPPISLWC
jgi:C4-dicarboxylate transporter DctM subunit